MAGRILGWSMDVTVIPTQFAAAAGTVYRELTKGRRTRLK
jgi:hypothetical protein